MATGCNQTEALSTLVIRMGSEGRVTITGSEGQWAGRREEGGGEAQLRHLHTRGLCSCCSIMTMKSVLDARYGGIHSNHVYVCAHFLVLYHPELVVKIVWDCRCHWHFSHASTYSHTRLRSTRDPNVQYGLFTTLNNPFNSIRTHTFRNCTVSTLSPLRVNSLLKHNSR